MVELEETSAAKDSYGGEERGLVEIVGFFRRRWPVIVGAAAPVALGASERGFLVALFREVRAAR